MNRAPFAVLAALLAGACGVEQSDATSGSGAGGTADPSTTVTTAGGAAPESCDPYEPRSPEPELVIGPNGFQPKILAEIDGAKSAIDLFMYQLDVQAIVDALVAAHKRGVKVRVLLDLKQAVNGAAKSKLEAGGVAVKAAPASFDNAHAKTMVVDGARALVLSGNFNGYTMQQERNYAALDLAADDVADVEAVFERDWSGAALDLSCTRLVVSPDNARDRLGKLVAGAKKSLDLAVMYVSDADMLKAIKARAAAGVPVRVLLADPAWIAGNSATAADLAAAGIPAKFYKKLDLHAKLVLTDAAAFVGSENLSYTSLQKNREIGVLLTEPTPLAGIRKQFEADWAAGVAP